MMLVADGLNFFLRQALFGLLPPESWGISWQLASQKKVSIVLCSGYACTCLHVTCCHNDVRQTTTCKIHWIITRSCTPSRRSFTWGWTDDTDGPKHWGVGKLWSFIGSKHRSHVNINQCTTDKRCNYHRCFSKKKIGETTYSEHPEILNPRRPKSNVLPFGFMLCHLQILPLPLLLEEVLRSVWPDQR